MMEAKIYDKMVTVAFNPKDVCYICVRGFECETAFVNGKTFTFSYSSVCKLINKLPRVYNHKLLCGVHINPENISFYTKTGALYDVEFRNGKTLKNCSGVDFDNVIDKMDIDRSM